MAAYPSYTSIPQGGESRITPLGQSVRIDQAEDNSIRGFSAASVYPYRIDLVHPDRDLVDYDTIIAHWAGEGVSAFAFTFAKDLAAYTVRYLEQPRYEIITGALQVNILVSLVGTKD